MSLSARERILKLRETEFKLQKLQNDLINGNKDSSPATMSEFLSHHRELMNLPGSNRDSLPFRFNFQAPKQYMELKQTQKLTLSPKISARSVNRIQSFKEQFDNDGPGKTTSSNKIGLAGRPFPFRSLLIENAKLSSNTLGFPKLDRYSVLNKAPHLRGLNSKTYKGFNRIKASSSRLGKHIRINKTNESKFEQDFPIIRSKSNKKVKLMWNHQDLSESASTVVESELVFGASVDDVKIGSKTSKDLKRRDSENLKESVAYALGSSNLIGVILPSNSSHTSGRGPSTWGKKGPSVPLRTINRKIESEDENDSISVKEAVTVLRRRKFPERKSLAAAIPSPHERGLIGVEISSFDPQCAFFYRDRKGNYNPHLKHSKSVTESMKNMKWGRTKLG